MSKGSNYYGGFFWVAVVSFIVPFFVGWKAFNNLKPTTKPAPAVDASGVDHKIWDYLLKSYVSNGLVDYDGMKKDYLFREYLRELGACDPSRLDSEDDRLALLCNAYNAFVINGVISHEIRDSVDGRGFFGIAEHIYAGKTVTLDEVEKSMILPIFKEPRAHVGLVCAARGCPPIRAEAFTGKHVRQQLEDQSVLFANNPQHVRFDAGTGVLSLSMILKWYGGDFDERYPEGGYMAWIHRLTSDPEIRKATSPENRGNTNVAFIEYNWALNSQADPGKPAPVKKKSGGFGSGSSPDE